MCRNACRSTRSLIAALLLAATPALAAPPMHPTKEPSVVSTARAKYTLVQGDQEVGHESVTRRTLDNNTIRFEAEDVVKNPGVTMTVKSELVVEEESIFPRSYRAAKTITQPTDVFEHVVTVDMYANVAVLGSELKGSKDHTPRRGTGRDRDLGSGDAVSLVSTPVLDRSNQRRPPAHPVDRPGLGRDRQRRDVRGRPVHHRRAGQRKPRLRCTGRNASA